jgi:hypothetical protein
VENLQTFVKRLSKAVGCYYHTNEKENIYSLKKNNTMVKGGMCVFGWVTHYRTEDLFRVDTEKDWADAQAIADADSRITNLNWNRTGLRYKVSRNSNGKDYQKAVRALQVIIKNKCGKCG